MTATLEDAPPDLTDDRLYAEDPDDDPDDPASDETAGQAPDGPADPAAPYGYTVDRVTGERRPKLRPGRPRTPPDADELAAAADPVPRVPDQPPPDEAPRGRHGRRGRVRAARPGRDDHDPAVPPMPRGGTIAKGVDKLYRRAGKVVRAFDPDIGQAIIECTRPDPDDPDELTVGQAWEALCRTNPRIRAFVLRAISGGVWSDLVMAHAPIGIAIVMKPAIAERIPFGNLMASWLEPDEDTGETDLRPEDAADMAGLASDQLQRMADRVADGIPPEMAARARRAAERAASRIANGLAPGDDPDLPPEIRARLTAARRAQPKRSSRAKRRR